MYSIGHSPTRQLANARFKFQTAVTPVQIIQSIQYYIILKETFIFFFSFTRCVSLSETSVSKSQGASWVRGPRAFSTGL